tara:strand:- start:923 stop:1222 length:300 start_codon:yes stop_codon:yes gene_type:complete
MLLDKLIHKYEIEIIELEALYNKGHVKNRFLFHQLKIVIEDLKQLKLEQLEDFKRETLTNHTQPKQEPIFENILNELSDMEGRILKSINKEKLRRISQK